MRKDDLYQKDTDSELQRYRKQISQIGTGQGMINS
jgi:hypothetical protein